MWWLLLLLLLLVVLLPAALVWAVTYWLFHEDRFDYDAGKRSKSLADLPGSNLITRTKVVVIGTSHPLAVSTMPGAPLEERAGWRLAQALRVPYLELSNVNVLLTAGEHSNEARDEDAEGPEAGRPPSRSKDWRRDAEVKRDFPRRVGDMVRRFFSKNKYNGYVIEMTIDRWEVYDPLFEEARDIVWLDMTLRQKLLQLLRRVVAVLLLGSSRPMFREDVREEQDGKVIPRDELHYTNYWYRWSNLVRFWDESRSLLAKTISVHYKNLQTAPFILDHNGQLECWHLRSPSQVEAFLRAVRAEKGTG